MADTGKVLQEEFLSWLRAGVRDEKVCVSDDVEWNKRYPLVLRDSEEFVCKEESFARAFDLVLAIRDKETGTIRRIFPIEFKSNKDCLDDRVCSQIATHIFCFGVSVVVLDSEIAYKLMGQKEALQMLPAYVFVKKHEGFIKISSPGERPEYPSFYDDSIVQVLPKGYKIHSARLTGYFKQLDHVMRKLYAARLCSSYGDTNGFWELSDEELKVVMMLLVKAKAIDAQETFYKISSEFEKLGKKIGKLDKEGEE
jgi:hypothetical protein